MLAFDKGIGDEYTIDEIYDSDSATKTAGDNLDSKSTGNMRCVYRTPQNLEQQTGDESFQYNELVVNTFSKGNTSKRLQPSYVVFIRKMVSNEFEKKLEEKKWEETLRAAAEFEIPIIYLDEKEIMLSQYNDISQEMNHSTNIGALSPKIRHFIERYGKEQLHGCVPDETLAKVGSSFPLQDTINIDSAGAGR